MDPRRYNMIFGGQFDKMEGLVYDCFDEDTHVCDSFALPTGTKYYGGIDWGYTDPFVCTVRAVTPSGYHFQVSEFVKSRMQIGEQIAIAKQKMLTYGITKFVADPSRPENIEAFNREGIPTIPADNRIQLGVDKHYELIASGRFKVFKDSSPNFLDEISMYHYPEETDLKPDQDSKDRLPVGQNDHVMDCVRYTTMATVNIDKRAPKNPNEINKELSIDHEIRLKQLKKIKKRFPGSENFS